MSSFHAPFRCLGGMSQFHYWGHFGKTKTLANVKRRFIWFGMHKAVDIYCRQCDTCAKYKTDGKKRRSDLRTQVTGVPMERVCIDIVGPFPESTSGNKYALVVTDYFTKFVEIYPLSKSGGHLSRIRSGSGILFQVRIPISFTLTKGRNSSLNSSLNFAKF